MTSERRAPGKASWGVFAGITLLGAVLYMVLAHYGSVWADEAYSLAMIRHSYGEMLSLTAADVHPPLYYFLLKLCTAPFGYSMLSVQIFTVLPYCLLLLFGGIALEKLFSRRAGWLFSGLFLLYPFALQYSCEIRMYTWAALFVFFCGIYAVRAVEERGFRNWALLTFFGLCAAYTHYFALVSVGMIYLLLLVAVCKKKDGMGKAWILCAVISVVIYIPWLRAFLGQLAFKVSNDYWIPPITVPFLLGFIRHLFGSDVFFPYIIVCAPSFLAAFISLLRSGTQREKYLALGGLFVPVGTILVGVIAGLLVRPVFVIHYVMPAVPLMIAFLAVSLGQMRPKALRRVILGLFLVGGVINYALTLRSEIVTDGPQLNGDYASALGGDCCVCDTGEIHTAAVLAYYVPETPVYADIYTDVPEANAFDNQHPLEEYVPGKADTVILLVAKDADPAEQLAACGEGYSVEYLGSVTAVEVTSDVYRLTK